MVLKLQLWDNVSRPVEVSSIHIIQAPGHTYLKIKTASGSALLLGAPGDELHQTLSRLADRSRGRTAAEMKGVT